MEVRDNFTKFNALRKDHPCFIFDSYHYELKDNHLLINLKYIIQDDIVFQPSVRIAWNKKGSRPFSGLSAEVLDNLVFHAGMAELVSYWKATCSPVVVLPDKTMTPDQLAFWKKLYFNGLGEFFHVNSIRASYDSLFNFEGHRDGEPRPVELELTGPALVPVGGGKDSAVTVALLTRSEMTWVPFAINPSSATRAVIMAAGKQAEEGVIITRTIDPVLLELNAAGYLNGHTPFSAVVAFYSLIAAYLTGSSDIVLSNESSANEATIPGTQINHQYSKTYEFEKDFRDYVNRYISPSFNYFSFLRPLTELQIAALFSKFPRYFPIFRSCNVGSKQGAWCGHCPKCLFTWIILSPYLGQEQLRGIFGQDLMDDQELYPTLDELTGRSETKPFECIGTVDEINAAMEMLSGQYKEKEPPALVRYYRQRSRGALKGGNTFQELSKAWNGQHFVPDVYLKILRHGEGH